MAMTSIEADKRAGTTAPSTAPCKVSKSSGHSQTTKTVKAK